LGVLLKINKNHDWILFNGRHVGDKIRQRYSYYKSIVDSWYLSSYKYLSIIWYKVDSIMVSMVLNRYSWW